MHTNPLHSSILPQLPLKLKKKPVAKKLVSLITHIWQKLFFYGKTTFSNPPQNVAKTSVVIIGSGPAGYTAAIYAARANLTPVVYEGDFPSGGQLITATAVENYPGFPEGIEGPNLVDNLRKQAQHFGATLIEDKVTEIDFSHYPYSIKGKNHSHCAHAVIIATGAKAKRLDIPGTRDGELWQKGVSTCATCDGALPMFRNRHVYVVGGGDSAMEEALFLAKFAAKIFVVHRRNKLRASHIMQKRVLNHPKITVLWDSAITRVEGDERVKQVVIKNLKNGQVASHEAAGVFFAIGHTPNTEFLKNQVALDSKGYITVVPGTCQTSLPLVFAAGDVQDPVYRQAITAAASGCMAALDAERALDAAHG